MIKATFGAGCFWGIEAAFRNVEGVTATAVGYLGGQMDSPTYEDVCTGRSGHAEVVEVTFDPAVTDYNTLLDVFWQSHDPTTLNRQGPDMGTQYRSAFFFHDEKQRLLAETSMEILDKGGLFGRPIVTEITPATIFFLAEDDHQQYFEKRGMTACGSPTLVRAATS